MKLRKLILLAIGLSSSSMVFADWEDAKLVDSVNIDYKYARCVYQVSSYSNFAGHRFSIIIEGGRYSCPYYVKYDPVSRKWRED